MIQQFATGKFNGNCPSTKPADFICKSTSLPEFDHDIKFQIWDTTGQEKYRSITPYSTKIPSTKY